MGRGHLSVTFEGGWVCLALVVRFIFRRNPIDFGRTACRAALGIVSVGLSTEARHDWSDEAFGDLEQEIWESLKSRSDNEIGAGLLWHASSIMIHGWSDRAHYSGAPTASRRGLFHLLRHAIWSYLGSKWGSLWLSLVVIFVMLLSFSIQVIGLLPSAWAALGMSCGIILSLVSGIAIDRRIARQERSSREDD